MFTMEYYSAVKKNESLPFATWMDKEGIMLTAVRQTERDTYLRISVLCGI